MDKESRIYRWGLSAFGLISFIGIWEYTMGTLKIFTPVTLPAPSLIFQEYFRLWDLIYANLIDTLVVAAVGFSLATSIGVFVAIIFTINDKVRRNLMPLVVAGNTVPRITLIPLFIFYLGGDFGTKYVVTAWIAFFPILINALEGLGNTSKEELNLLNILDSSIWQEYRYIRIPNALPATFDGLKLGLGSAFVGAIVTEIIASNTGLGYLVVFALLDLQTPLVFAVDIIVGVISTIAFFGLFLIQDRVVYWKKTDLFTEQS